MDSQSEDGKTKNYLNAINQWTVNQKMEIDEEKNNSNAYNLNQSTSISHKTLTEREINRTYGQD